MSSTFIRKQLAELRNANKGNMRGYGNYQSSKFKSVVLTIDGKKVELSREDYDAYIAKIKEEKRKSVETQKGFDPKTGEPL